jgi:glycosyltransferase involved in cell wall biosynthesis
MTTAILYISYDGMLEPLGQSQVLAYLERLAQDHAIHLLSFEKPADLADRDRREAIAGRISAAGISWHPMRYHKTPSAAATAYDIAVGSARAIGLARRHRIGIVHARSYVAGLMGLAVKRATGARFLFDMRGFWADERVEGGLWPANGALYRAAKRVERSLLLASDHVVTLTHTSAGELRNWPFLQGRTPPISVIPTCADLDRFAIQRPPQREPFVLGYVGSVGTWYLLDEMLRFFTVLRAQVPGARLLFVNRDGHEQIRARAAAHGITPSELELCAATHGEMPGMISRMSAGMAFYRPGYSRIACAPTKLAEYLGCGVPCIGSATVGDVGDILADRRVGVPVDSFSDSDLDGYVRQIVALARDDETPSRCRRTALELFSLEAGVAAYAAVYQSSSGRPRECA